ncbi:ABC transporter permease [Chelatococcus sp. YT9]|uniref:ABC transporter permease n=1 Tax=Chelatococcus sp. YT9 TaxID=2835635 RepID=UPI001BCB6069|nr:ABC transporter permease [Chelatococcus sp. YT9]MBS7701282.1 ABC transporter permease [Chelatococcus sp. YT9]
MRQVEKLGKGLRTYVVLAGLFIMAPQAIVFVVAFSSASFVSFPPPGFSLRWFEQVLADPTFMRPMWNSVVLGLLATVFAAIVAVPAAIALVRYPFRFSTAIQTFLLSPLSMPALILAIALLFYLNAIGLGNTFAGLVIGHVVITIPYLLRTIVAVYASTDPRIEEAAYTLGSPPLATFWHVTLPMLRPALFAGGMFAFLISFDEVAISLLLSNARSMTLPVAILGYLVNNYDPAVAAISVVKMIIVIIGLIALEYTYGLRNLTLPSNQEQRRNG